MHNQLDISPSPATNTDASGTQQPCFFFKPPAEIGVCIYEYAFSPDTDDDPVKDGKFDHNGVCLKFPYVKRQNWRTSSALLRVSRAIRQIIYSAATFHFHVNKIDYTASSEWLDDIGKEQTKLITRLLISWEPSERVLKKSTRLQCANQGAITRMESHTPGFGYQNAYASRGQSGERLDGFYLQNTELILNESNISHGVATILGRRYDILESKQTLSSWTMAHRMFLRIFTKLGHVKQIFLRSLNWALHPEDLDVDLGI